MIRLRDSIECLCNSPQRLRILDVLDSAQMDVRDLMAALDSPRSTVQRNLTVLQERRWIEETCSGYTATTAGRLLHEELMSTIETADTIECMAPFFEAADAPSGVDVRQLNDPLVTTPESDHPHLPRKRLMTIFGEADLVQGFLPVVSHLSVEHSRRVDSDTVPECEYVLSSGAFDALRQQSANGGADGDETDPPAHIDVRVYDGDLPYGLFVSDNALALAAYNEVSRIEAVVESTSKETVEWGKRMYETYRDQSTRLCGAELVE